jgi:hypothetical protein
MMLASQCPKIRAFVIDAGALASESQSCRWPSAESMGWTWH